MLLTREEIAATMGIPLDRVNYLFAKCGHQMPKQGWSPGKGPKGRALYELEDFRKVHFSREEWAKATKARNLALEYKRKRTEHLLAKPMTFAQSVVLMRSKGYPILAIARRLKSTVQEVLSIAERL